MRHRRESSRSRLNPSGNARLTGLVGLLLLAPAVVELATVVLGVHTFMSLHVFVGLALIPAVLLKLASTGWRFTRYYTRSSPYVEQGPPQIAMRLLAPLLVAATLALFGSGVAMGLLHGHALTLARRVHGPASVIWLIVFGLHALVYLKRALIGSSREIGASGSLTRGRRARAYLVGVACACGLALGAATVPAQHRWVHLSRDHHYHHRERAAATPDIGRA